MKWRLLVVGLWLLTGLPVAAQSGGDVLPEANRSYLICDWGLLTIEQATEPAVTFLTITEPTAYSGLEGTTFTVAGEGGGLFEGNVVVDVSAAGATLFSEPTVLQAAEMGAAGTWSLDVDLGLLAGPTPVTVRAYATSPRDGATVAAASIQLNANSASGLPFVKIESPVGSAAVTGFPLVIEGSAGAVFENNLAIEVRDRATDALLADTAATVETDELAGIGPFSAEVLLEVDPGTTIVIHAFQPPVVDDEPITVTDTQFAVINPLGRTYDRFLTIRADDPLNMSDDVCAAAAGEFENENTRPLTINAVEVGATITPQPWVQVTIEAAGPSVCPAPLRTRTIRADTTYHIELYYDTTEPVPCTLDLAPLTRYVWLGTLPSPEYSVTVNGEPAG